ncbi:MAG: 30S ribosomal protein S6--L-glutamate ligase [Rickettsiales bacterium]|nr:30S ribosomal protein S6--L-glutamate ligase [Rickettsiales bacterium]
MKIGLLVSEKGLYSHKRLKEEAERKGHKLRIINLTECFVNITNDTPTIYDKNGKPIRDLDAVIPRIEPAITFYGTAILRQFEMLGVYSLNSSIAVLNARDKLKSLQILANNNIPMPSTGIAHSPASINSIVQSLGGAPLIIKLVEGTEGEGVVLAETNSAAKSVISAFKQLNANVIVQEFIKESSGRDVRCFVVGSKVVASMERIAGEGEYRANFHLGASVQPITITKEEREMAIRASKVMGMDVAGVDILRSNRGSLVLEINSSPGLEGIEKATKKNVAGFMIDYIEQNVNKSSKKTK